ncbi:sigma-70 family RNA polymerase sigma factor [Mesorhizobium prunaredense]|nr:sigma-70 family RNA polymerase sigma factor [Mesorhizobium prunaredense]
MTELPREGALKPLAGKTKEGKPYARPPAVEAEIEAVLEWPLPKAFALAAAGKLRPQTLVYLMRNFRPNRPDPKYDTLVIAFFSRLERAGDRMIRDLSDLDRERVNDLVKDKALWLIEADRLDIFEMSFKTGAERLYYSARAVVRLRSKTEVSREDLVGPDSDLTGEEAADALSMVSDSSMPLAEARTMLNQVLEMLNEKERLAIFYVLQARMTETEAGAQMGCTARNIRYLLKSAAAKARATEERARQGARERDTR